MEKYIIISVLVRNFNGTRSLNGMYHLEGFQLGNSEKPKCLQIEFTFIMTIYMLMEIYTIV